MLLPRQIHFSREWTYFILGSCVCVCVFLSRWWRSLLWSGSCAGWMFIYSVGYYFTVLHMSGVSCCNAVVFVVVVVLDIHSFIRFCFPLVDQTDCIPKSLVLRVLEMCPIAPHQPAVDILAGVQRQALGPCLDYPPKVSVGVISWRWLLGRARELHQASIRPNVRAGMC